MRVLNLKISVFIALAGLSFFASVARADFPVCDATNMGRQMWDINDVEQYDMQFCDGAQWFSMALAPRGATNGDGRACGATDGGKIVWDATNLEYQFCDDTTTWWSMKGKQLTACTVAGKQQFASSVMQFCNGTNWYSMGPTIVIIDYTDNTYGVGANKTYTVPAGLTGMNITAWGAGGGGGGAQASGASGQAGSTGGTTTVTTPLDTLTATGGTGGGGGVANQTSSGGTGGTGSSNATYYKPGGNGYSTSITTGGYGGDAYKGGKGGNPARKSGQLAGGIPGGGGAGKSATGPRRGGGGGGAGGYVFRSYGTSLTAGQTINITLGVGGTGGAGGSGTLNGYDGGNGRAVITYW